LSESLLRTNILQPNDPLLVDPHKIRVFIHDQFNSIITNTTFSDQRIKSVGQVKDINDVAELLYTAIQDYEEKKHVSNDAKLKIVYEFPEEDIETEVVSIGIANRQPGAFSKGSPYEGKIKNRKPILREVFDDTENPGYKKAILGFYYDNTIRLTAWARTNKVVNRRAVWLEDFIEEYSWFFIYNGLNRILFEGWKSPEILHLNNNRYFGRPIDFFVRTEKIQVLSEKTLEEIYINLHVKNT
jgi:hypothetical protein